MDEVEAWCKTICIITIACGVLIAIMPQNKLSSAVKALTGIVLVYSFIMPIASFDEISISFDYLSSSQHLTDLEALASNNVIEQAEKMLKEEVDALLKENGIIGESEIKIEAKNGEAKVQKITISGHLNGSEKEKIITEIVNGLQKEINIEFSG